MNQLATGTKIKVIEAQHQYSSILRRGEAPFYEASTHNTAIQRWVGHQYFGLRGTRLAKIINLFRQSSRMNFDKKTCVPICRSPRSENVFCSSLNPYKKSTDSVQPRESRKNSHLSCSLFAVVILHNWIICWAIFRVVLICYYGRAYTRIDKSIQR